MLTSFDQTSFPSSSKTGIEAIAESSDSLKRGVLGCVKAGSWAFSEVGGKGEDCAVFNSEELMFSPTVDISGRTWLREVRVINACASTARQR